MTDEHGHILIVDDNAMNRLKLAHSLEQEGHTATLAKNGEEALQLLHAQPFDVVLLDILMPVMDGYQVLEQIKGGVMRDIPVIVISALDEMESIVRCIEMGAEDYLPKSFDPVLLRARLRASLQKKKLRDLERAYLQQEVMLRQSEKLATIGKLSAGMAHELNNPAAAAVRGTKEMRTALSELQESYLRLCAAGLTGTQNERLAALYTATLTRAVTPLTLDPLSRSDREADLQDWLDAQGVSDSWKFASALVNLGLSPDSLEAVAANFPAELLQSVITWLYSSFTLISVLEEIGRGVGHISKVVMALTSYTFMDQAPVQLVDIHEGLENTLVMMESKLKPGVTVLRDFASRLPRIQAYGAELNQVWTSIIDNAVDAVHGAGTIRLQTSFDSQWLIVTIEDDGPGIPADIQSKVFDPFYTTKPPGQGTGMGLNICYNVVVEKHRGQIAVESQPGRTCFVVRLPLSTAS
jgi:signal transduction histidine kinase